MMKLVYWFLSRSVKPLFCLGMIFFLLTPSTFVNAKVYIDINAPTVRRFPVAIATFKISGKDPGLERQVQGLSKLLSQDLIYSGFFELVDQELYLGDLEDMGVKARGISFRDWAVTGAMGLVTGMCKKKGEKLELELRLFDVSMGKRILGKKYTVSPSQAPEAIHKFANEIIFIFTGEQGIFSSRIAFVSTRTGNKELFMMNFDGSNVKKITHNGSINLLPSWSPDGKKLLFTSYQRGNPGLYVMDLDKRKQVLLSGRAGLSMGGRWSPKEDKIALSVSYQGNSDLILIKPNGKRIKKLTWDWGIDVSPSWSPDGKKIAFVSSRSGNPHIYVLDLEEDRVVRRTFEGKYNSSPAWSPRGDKIAFTGRYEGLFQIFLMDPDGSELQVLTDEGENEHPSWSPDGRHIAFSSNREGSSYIYIMFPDGSSQKRLTSGGGNDTNPAWSGRLRF